MASKLTNRSRLGKTYGPSAIRLCYDHECLTGGSSAIQKTKGHEEHHRKCFLVPVYLLLTAFKLHMSDMANLKECVRDYDDSIPKDIQSNPKTKAFKITSNFYHPKSKPLLYAQTEKYSYIFTG